MFHVGFFSRRIWNSGLLFVNVIFYECKVIQCKKVKKKFASDQNVPETRDEFLPNKPDVVEGVGKLFDGEMECRKKDITTHTQTHTTINNQIGSNAIRVHKLYGRRR